MTILIGQSQIPTHMPLANVRWALQAIQLASATAPALGRCMCRTLALLVLAKKLMFKKEREREKEKEEKTQSQKGAHNSTMKSRKKKPNHKNKHITAQ
jgi:hypothetical protein